MSYLNREQFDRLIKHINAARVSIDGKKFKHVEAHDIRAHLNRIFGFARWSAETLSCSLIFETVAAPGEHTYKKTGKTNSIPVWTVCYKAQAMLTVKAPDGTPLATYTEYATGDSQANPDRADAHDLAIKTAESQALKRSAMNLGDQFGLSLYNNGSIEALVLDCVIKPDKPQEQENSPGAKG